MADPSHTSEITAAILRDFDSQINEVEALLERLRAARSVLSGDSVPARQEAAEQITQAPEPPAPEPEPPTPEPTPEPPEPTPEPAEQRPTPIGAKTDRYVGLREWAIENAPFTRGEVAVAYGTTRTNSSLIERLNSFVTEGLLKETREARGPSQAASPPTVYRLKGQPAPEPTPPKKATPPRQRSGVPPEDIKEWISKQRQFTAVDMANHFNRTSAWVYWVFKEHPDWVHRLVATKQGQQMLFAPGPAITSEPPPSEPEPPPQYQGRGGGAKGGPVPISEVEKWVREKGEFTIKELAANFQRSEPWASLIMRENTYLAERTGKRRKLSVVFRAKREAEPPPAEPDEEPELPEPTDAAVPTLANVRDAVRELAKGERDGKPFTPRGIAEPNEWSVETTTRRLEALAEADIVADVSVGELRLFRYRRPYSPGAAAEYDAAVREGQTVAMAPSEPVEGTGKGLQVTNKDVRALVNAIVAKGAKVVRATNSHFQVTHPGAPGKKVLISSTPRSSRSVENDRSRVRRTLGLAV